MTTINPTSSQLPSAAIQAQMLALQAQAAQQSQLQAQGQYAAPQSLVGQAPVGQQAQAQVQPVYVQSASQVPQGAIPITQAQVAQLMASSQGPAIAQATLAAQAVNAPTSTAKTLLKSILVGAGIGAGVGGAVGLIPVLPPSLLTGALIGAGAGALAGLVVGLVKSKHNKQLLAQTAGMQQAPVQQEVAPIGTAPAGIGTGAGAAHTKIHLNEATKAKLKAKNDALKAAAK
jgi:hypothetical protein